MSSDKSESLSEVWSARYDDRDDEELACHVWAQQLAVREQAMAQPVKSFDMPDPPAPIPDLPAAPGDSTSR